MLQRQTAAGVLMKLRVHTSVLLGILGLANAGCASGESSSSGPPEPVPPIGESLQSPDLLPQVVFYPRVGNLTDDGWGSTGPGVVLMNDPVGPDSAFSWIHDTVDQTRIAGDVVVLCTHCGDVYSQTIYQLAPFNSVQTLLVPPQAKASDAQLVASRLQTAEIVYLADGDVGDYAAWAGTPIAAAVQAAYGRNGVIVGAGRGAAALGWAVLTAPVDSTTALTNPYAQSVTLVRGPFSLGVMAGAYVDLDLESTDRFGVLAAMTARAIHDGLVDSTSVAAMGIGLDDHAALAIDRFGNVTLLGDDDAPGLSWVLRGGAADQIAAGEPLVWSGARVYRFDSAGESAQIGPGCGTAFAYPVSIDGSASPPFSPANPYAAAGTATPCP
jgi:cyanophycinase-like exopeptidase